MKEPQPSSPNEPSTPEIVVEEERLLGVVKDALARDSGPRATDDYDAELLKLRDSLAEERLAEDQASILEQMDRIARLAAQRGRVVVGAADPDSPYFGHLRLQGEQGRRDILIGKRTWISGGVRIVDWRNAPISRVFYQFREGDDYEMEIAGKEVSGQVLARRTVTIAGGELLRVATPDHVYVRTAEGWSEPEGDLPELRGGTGAAARPDRTQLALGRTHRGGRAIRSDKHLPEIASLLDPEQFDLISSTKSGLIAIQGTAGSGKTTVALHRVAHLAFRDPQRFAPHRCLIVVLSPALASYISQVLPALGVEGVRVTTYRAWARELCLRHFPQLPKRIEEHTPGVVSRLKRHTALLTLLDEAVRAGVGTRPIEVFDELFTSRRWLGDGFARLAPGEFSENQLDEVHDWCRRQHNARVESLPSDDEEDLPRLDEEDDTLLLLLHQKLRGPLRRRRGKPLSYSHLVVDEVQDLSPVELKVLLGAVGPRDPITLAGDTAQQVNASSDFGGWERALGALGLDHVRISPLKVSYRSTTPIMETAHAVLGPLAPQEPARAPRPGAPVELFRFSSPGEGFTFLVDALADLCTSEPQANVAILTASAAQADEAFAALDRADLPQLSRVREYDFSFAPGIEVTDIRQAKGLEFDYVILWRVDAATYPVTDTARHLLHVGITRAAHQCWLLCVGTPSQLLPQSLRDRAR